MIGRSMKKCQENDASDQCNARRVGNHHAAPAQSSSGVTFIYFNFLYLAKDMTHMTHMILMISRIYRVAE